MPDIRDPGWRPSLRLLWWHAIPFVGPVMTSRRKGKARNELTVLRTTFLALVMSLFLFLIALRLIAAWDGGDEGWIPWAVVAAGTLSLVGVMWIRRRPLATASPDLATASPEMLAASYRASFYIGVGFAESAALLGAVAVFVGGSVWLYVLGLTFGLAGLWLMAPTRDDIERRQRELTTAGSPHSLIEGLVSVPPSGPKRRG